MTSTVAAVVVTYNRLELLKVCIEALHRQTRLPEAILVVNNGSTDGTEQWLERQSGLLVFHQTNSGGAGGFHRGMIEACKRGYDWVWVMDDDGFPHPQSLAKLMAFPRMGPCILNSLVVAKENPTRLAFSLRFNDHLITTLEEIEGLNAVFGSINPFNGTLIAREVFGKIGYPLKEMFIWGDETEFCLRALHNGFPLITVTDSLFSHPSAKEVVNQDWNPEIIWRKYYGFRNHSLLLRSSRTRLYKLQYTKYMINELIQIYKYQKSMKRVKFLVALEAYLDALTNNFNKKPYHIRSISRIISSRPKIN
ncbi:glycosyltransferase family 2 protein [Larkinella soli]|uniref:glycosyltransferase family 2 protein n=1 Tax=Larkinella soli TaxID=1770527 RepID=UPI000FFBAB9E|nr:glycosyltransferase family 2 protein [Larkinella soli]